MLYIITALYEEAKPFIETFSLKRNNAFSHFDLFSGEHAMVLITKPGLTRAAIAVSSLLTAFPPSEADFLLCIGVAGCADLSTPIGSAFRINKITDPFGHTFYPELIYALPFEEAELITCAEPVTDGSGSALYDMESSGIYEAAVTYFSCDRLFFVRVVSDHCGDFPSKEEIYRYIASVSGALLAQLDSIMQQPKNLLQFTAEEQAFIELVCERLRLSVTSSAQFTQLVRYLKAVGLDFVASMSDDLAEPLQFSVRTKKEGLNYLEQLKDKYL